jgi:hypothetical protein
VPCRAFYAFIHSFLAQQQRARAVPHDFTVGQARLGWAG